MGVYKYDATNDVLIPIAGVPSVPGIEDKVSTYTADATYWDTSPSSASSKPVTSGGIFTALADKADATDLANKVSKYSSDATQWDTSPTSASTKPVTSGGIYTEFLGKAPTNHASTATTYGAASMSNYGHVKLSDNYTSSAGTADQAIGASSKAVYDAYNNQNSNKANQTVIATKQTNTTPVRRYEIGDQFIYNNTLYKADAVINTTDTIRIGGNASTADNITTQISKLANPDYDSDWIVVPPQSWGQYFLPSGKFFSTKSRMTCICQQTARYFINYNANTSGASSICQAFNNESANIAVRFLVWL